MNKIISIAKKELFSFFSAPIAYIFLGAFVLVSYYNFFWVDQFFSRNIADLRPLFNSLPVLLIFLVAAVTMRMWSEEKRSGTIELLKTAPVAAYQLVVGKYLACLVLVAIALALTFSLPVTVNLLGELDWGPVVGAYLGALFLASVYIAVGLFISAKTDNQIVSLIVTILISMVLFFVGSEYFVNLFSPATEDLLKGFSTGAHFNSISRGVLNLSDLYYYLSVTAVFLILNFFTVEKLGWVKHAEKAEASQKHLKFRYFIGFLIANILLANFWFGSANLKVDLTENNVYTLSDSTKEMLRSVSEPLKITAFISKKTHPLLAPLIPQIKDLLAEYEAVSGSEVITETLDPKSDPAMEELAARKYSIKPVPLQISDRYEASVVNSYFDIVVEYGDNFEVLGFQDLIEVNVVGKSQVDVRLKNLEYDLTRAVKKAVYGFSSIETMFATLGTPLTLTAYVSADQNLPEALQEFRTTYESELNKVKQIAGDNFVVEQVVPEENPAVAERIAQEYGFKPMLASIMSNQQFYYYFVLEGPEDIPVQINLPPELTGEEFRKSLEAGLKRFAPGFLKTVGLVTPKASAPGNPMLGQAGGASKQFNYLYESLAKDHTVKNVDLANGIGNSVDLLMVLAPGELSKKELFALDQFVMRGGSLVVAASSFEMQQSQSAIELVSEQKSIIDYLGHHGIAVTDGSVYDLQNAAFPVPVRRDLGGFQVEEIKLVKYPLFPDIRGEGINKENSMLSGISQATFYWPSAIEFNAAANPDLTTTNLISSSGQSWQLAKPDAIPDYNLNPETGFAVPEQLSSFVLATVTAGKFKSYFAERDLSFLQEQAADDSISEETEGEAAPPEPATYSGFITSSPEASKIIVLASSDLLSDQSIQIASMGGTQAYLNNFQLAENSIDYSLEDPALLELRGRNSFTRTLFPLEEQQKLVYELMNYAAGLIGLLICWFIFRGIRRSRQERQTANYLS